MTSGVFFSADIAAVTVAPDRQRRDLGDLSELRESIRRTGLIHPIVVTRELVLVAGERRLSACKELGFTAISAQYVDTLDTKELELIELEENIKRKDLTWQEINDSVVRFHNLHKQDSPDWSAPDTAKAIGVDVSKIYRHLLVMKEREAGTELVIKAPSLATATNIAVRRAERRKAAEKRSIIATIEPDPEVVVPPRAAQILHADFTDFAREYSGPPFNFIHCDFPYGVGMHKSEQGGSDRDTAYTDTPEVYFALLSAFISSMPKLVAESAHLMFWFSLDFLTDTRRSLELAGWKVQTFPLIWLKSDNSGILSDKDRRPRHIYETALMASLGDRKIVQPVADAIAAPTSSIHHMSEKPTLVLDHFFRLFIDEYTVMLDPTCGSGNAVKCAEVAGASLAIGVEKEEEFFNRAWVNLEL